MVIIATPWTRSTVVVVVTYHRDFVWGLTLFLDRHLTDYYFAPMQAANQASIRHQMHFLLSVSLLAFLCPMHLQKKHVS